MSDATGSTLLTEGGGTPADQQGQPGATTPPANATPNTDTTQQAQDANDWRAALPEELRGNASLSKYKDVNALASSYVNLERLLGSEKIPLPKDDNDTEGWNRFYAAAGRPEAADKYEIAKPTLPEGVNVPYDEDEEKFWRNLAFENGLSAKQFGKMWETGVKSRMDKAIAWQAESAQAKTKAQDALRREWGDNYDGNLNLAKAAFRQYADPDLAQYLDETGLGNDPRFTKVYYKIGKAMNGATKVQGTAKSAEAPADIQRQIAEYRSKFNAELMDKSHPSHDIHVNHMRKLFEALHPD